jgi:hypothetical protein
MINENQQRIKTMAKKEVEVEDTNWTDSDPEFDTKVENAHDVPTELLELHELLEYQAALEGEKK